MKVALPIFLSPPSLPSLSFPSFSLPTPYVFLFLHISLFINWDRNYHKFLLFLTGHRMSKKKLDYPESISKQEHQPGGLYYLLSLNNFNIIT